MACNNYENNTTDREFEVRHHQVALDNALNITVTDLLKDTDLEGVAISKADIILIFSLYDNGIKDFFKSYMEYVQECQKKRFKAVDKPHWFLKRSID